MQIILNCQRCNGALTITPEMGGQVYSCPYCAQLFTAPHLHYPQQAPPGPPSVPSIIAGPSAAPPAAPPTNAKPPVLPPVIAAPTCATPTYTTPTYSAASARKPRQYVWEVNMALGITAAVIWLIALKCPIMKLKFSPGGPNYITLLKWQLEDWTINHLTLAVVLVIVAAVLALVLALMKKFMGISIAAIMAFVSLLITVSSYKGDSSYGMIVVLVGALVAIAAALVRVRKKT